MAKHHRKQHRRITPRKTAAGVHVRTIDVGELDAGDLTAANYVGKRGGERQKRNEARARRLLDQWTSKLVQAANKVAMYGAQVRRYDRIKKGGNSSE